MQTDRGLLGPEDLFRPQGRRVDRDSIVLEVAGEAVSLNDDPIWSHNGLAMIAANATHRRWPVARSRVAGEPEDCLVVADRAGPSLPLMAKHLTGVEDAWIIDSAISIDRRWHGASVLSRADGMLVGLLLVPDDGRASVGLLPELGGDESKERS